MFIATIQQFTSPSRGLSCGSLMVQRVWTLASQQQASVLSDPGQHSPPSWGKEAVESMWFNRCGLVFFIPTWPPSCARIQLLEVTSVLWNPAEQFTLLLGGGGCGSHVSQKVWAPGPYIHAGSKFNRMQIPGSGLSAVKLCPTFHHPEKEESVTIIW
jgi:hypothetical protein